MSGGKGVFSALQKAVMVTRRHNNLLIYKNKPEKKVSQAQVCDFTPVDVRWRIYPEKS